MDYSRKLVATGVAVLTVACGGKQAPEAPEPVAEAAAPVAAAPAPAPVQTQPPAPAPDYRRMTLEEQIHFGLDRSDLSPEARTKLGAKAEVLRTAPAVTLRIDGHADERGSDEYNLALSKRRAAEAKRYLVQQGIQASRIQTEGYGEEQPVDASSNESAWALNRRAGFQVTGGALSQR